MQYIDISKYKYVYKASPDHQYLLFGGISYSGSRLIANPVAKAAPVTPVHPDKGALTVNM